MYTGDLKKNQWEAADNISKQIVELEQLKNWEIIFYNHGGQFQKIDVI